MNVFPCDRGKGSVASIVTCFQCGKFWTPYKSSVRIDQSIVMKIITTTTIIVSVTRAYRYMTCKRGQTDQHSHYGQQREDQQMHSQSAHPAVSRFQFADICLPLRGRRERLRGFTVFPRSHKAYALSAWQALHGISAAEPCFSVDMRKPISCRRTDCARTQAGVAWRY